MSEQAKKTPLIDLLRDVPKDHRTQWPIQWSGDGWVSGHAMCPVGILAHEAADRIVELEAALASSEEKSSPQAAVPDGYVVTPRDALDGVLYLAGLVVTSTNLGSKEREHFKTCCDALLSTGKENNNE
jgi:hypothetical protein